MATSSHSSNADMLLTISDEHSPRAVICAPISAVAEAMDLLYLDIPAGQTTPNTLEFVCAVSRQVALTRKSLILMQLKAETQILNQQLSLAHDIQSKLVPSEPELRFEIDVAVCYKPAMWVGIMSNLQATLRTTMTFCTELSSAVESVNRHLCQSMRDDMFVAFFLGLFDPSENKLAYVNAGNIPPLIMRPSERAQLLDEVSNPPLGILESPFEMGVEIIPPAATLLVVTDGITEARSPEGDFFEIDRLAKLVTDSEVPSAQSLVQLVTKRVTDFRQMLAQQDDITVFALVNNKT
jgi:serine phosphatase RsbU (regulator of sigma subunit)